MTFVEGPALVNWRRPIKIQNDHATITLQWNIIVEQQEDWWEIEDGSPRSGSLEPGESERIYLCIDRSGKEDGEYPGHFKVKATGPGYSRTEEVNFIMQVGGEDSEDPEPEPVGPTYEPNAPTAIVFADCETEPISIRSLKILNKHPSGVLNWKLKTRYQEEWWQITPDSPQSGTLNPGKSTSIAIVVDRANKVNGEYWDHFMLHFSGSGFRDSVLVALSMEVGQPDSLGPRLININTNSSAKPNQLVLTFDKYLDMNRSYKASNFILTPSISISNISVMQDKVYIKTADHQYETKYEIKIPQITDMRNRTATDLNAVYQFYRCCAGADLKMTTGSGDYEWDVALPGKRIYTDQTFKLGQIPPDLYGVAMLRTRHEDLCVNNLSISFTTGCNDVRVLLAYDPRQSASWDNEWVRRDYKKLTYQLPVEGIPDVISFDLYESNVTFQSDHLVTLFQNGALTKDELMYFVLVRGIKNVSGKVNYFMTNKGVPDVLLKLPAGIIGAQSITIDSLFEFAELTAYADLFITPTKADDISRMTILMHDAWLAAQISMEKISTPTAHQLMVADADSNEKVTMVDAELIACHVVGLNSDSGSQVGKWRFLPSTRIYEPLMENLADQNFTAMVIGDVDFNWQPLNLINQSHLTQFTLTAGIDSTKAAYHISAPELIIASTETTVTIPLVVTEDLSGRGITSYTAEIDWNESVIKNPHISRIGTLIAGWGDHNYYQNDKIPGKIIFGQFSADSSLIGQGVLFNLIFDIVGKPGDSTRIDLNLFALNNCESVLTDSHLRINNPPECDHLVLSPPVPLENDSLKGTYLYHDIDGDTEKQSQIQWYKNGIEQPEFNNSRTIPSSVTHAGEQWYFIVIPNDGIESGKAKQSPIVIINHPVRARMNVFPIFGKPALSVKFSNYSTDNSIRFHWDFGDGAKLHLTGMGQVPEHTYSKTGYYTVSLQAIGKAGIDSIIYPQLICVDENATELVLIDSGATRSYRGWSKVIDHNVITDEGNVMTTFANAWANFAFPNNEQREITQLRLKRSSYYSTSNPDWKVNAFEIQTASNLTEFRLLLSAKLDSDDWVIYPIKDSSPVRYVRLQLLSSEDSNQDSCEFCELQIFSKPVAASFVETHLYLKPYTFRIINNYPNPFNNTTIIAYDIAEPAQITLSIYNVQGQIVRKLINKTQEPNTYHIIWDGTDDNGQTVVNGIYFCRMRISCRENEFCLPTHKLVLLK